MTAVRRSPEQQFQAARSHRSAAGPPAAPAADRPSRLPLSLVTLLAALGVLLASVAYASGRMGHASSPWVNRTYWAGQALVVFPAAERLLSRRRLTVNDTAGIAIVLTVAEYVLKVCYSPVGFTFADEFLHWRGTTNLLQTGAYSVNYGLPIGPQYPGLEEVTSALVSATGLSVFVAGLIVAGIAHLLYICLLYCIYHGFSRSHRIAGIAVLIYSATPALTSFNSMFVYETLALTFMGLGILAAWRAATERTRSRRARWFVIAIIAIAATTMTHHVTSYMLVGSLFLISAASLLARSRRVTVTLLSLAMISAVAVLCWIAFVATDTIGYFRPTVEGVVQGISALQSGQSSHAASTAASPRGDQALEALGVLVLSVLVLMGWWQVWRRNRRNPWVLGMAICSAGWFGALAVRLGTPDGQELAGRTATFVYIPVAFIAGLALIRLISLGIRRRWDYVAISFGVVVTVGLVFDGLANGWPPYWERLPGPHQVAGFERSVDPETIATADWTLSALGPGNRIASDIGIYPVLDGYGDQNPLQDIDYLYTTRTFTTQIARQARAQDVQYVLVDRRLSEALPASGSYFPGGAGTGPAPIPLADLTKYNRLPGVAREFDDGTIVIYDLRGLQYGP